MGLKPVFLVTWKVRTRRIAVRGQPEQKVVRPPVRKYRPQNDHVERSDLAKRFFIAGWESETQHDLIG
jgi:hypothetical protein